MNKDYNKDFIKLINIGRYVKKANNRKIIIWGAGDIGKKVYETLSENNISTYAFIDSNLGTNNKEFCGVKVQTPEILNNNEKFYIIVAIMNYYEEISVFLDKRNYNEIEDYLYIFHKPLIIEKDEEYIDIYGNKISGKKGNKYNIVAYNSELTFFSERVEESAKMFCCNSKIKLEKNCTVKGGSTIYCCDNSELNFGECVEIGEGNEIRCYDNSKLVISSSCNINEKAYIECYKNSELNISCGCYFKQKACCTCFDSSKLIIDSKCYFDERAFISCDKNSELNISYGCYFEHKLYCTCFDNSKLIIGSECYFNEGAILTCKVDSNLSIGDKCTFGKYLAIGNRFSSIVNIGVDIMASHNVAIFNNDHPIFDIHTKTRIKKQNIVKIKNHVWLGIKSTVLTGAEIGEGSIVGSNSVVTKRFPNNCTIAGMPAKLLRKDIAWERDETDIRLIDKKYFNATKQYNEEE